MAKSGTKKSGNKGAEREKALRSRIARIKQAIAGSGDTSSTEHRELRKRLKRAQRKLTRQRVMAERGQKAEAGEASE